MLQPSTSLKALSASPAKGSTMLARHANLLIAVAGTVGLGLSRNYFGAVSSLAVIGVGCAPSAW